MLQGAGGSFLSFRFPFCLMKHVASPGSRPPTASTLGPRITLFIQWSCHGGRGALSRLQAWGNVWASLLGVCVCVHARARMCLCVCMCEWVRECECGGRGCGPVCQRPRLGGHCRRRGRGPGLTGSWAPAPRGRAGLRCPRRRPGAGTRSGSRAWARSAAGSP